MIASPARSQEVAIIYPGDAVVTGFSGTVSPIEELPDGINLLDETFIDLEGPVAQFLSLGFPGGPPAGQLINAPKTFTISARQTGQVFGIALDDGVRDGTIERIPDIFLTATSVLGIQTVIPDKDGDGRPERIVSGHPHARWMDGQFGIDAGGGPGSVWRVNGITGEVTLFANIELLGEPNSGPGLGNIAFDKRNRQLFVSDLDTGMIHRLDMEGNDLELFDHGLFGRPNFGLDPVAHDPFVRMDITSPDFDAEDPDTWGYADERRQVWGLTVHGRRLYYAVTAGLQIWSVGINRDGTFANDARWELDVVGSPKANPVSDMLFDRRGFMYLAQRGEIISQYDYTAYAKPRKSKVLRYWREVPDDPLTPSVWVSEPHEYAIGFPVNHRNTDGGIDLGYGYDREYNLNPGACEQMLWSTGDSLRENPDYTELLLTGGPLNVNGLQGNDKDLVRPANVPPWSTYFVDYDDRFDSPEVDGDVGDVEIWRPCDPGYGEYYPPFDVPPYYPICIPGEPGCPPEDLPVCVELTGIDFYCGIDGHWVAEIYMNDTSGLGLDSLKASSLTPGIGVNPTLQTRPGPFTPFTLTEQGAFPGEHYDVGMCFYRGADALTGEPFPCCQVRLPLSSPAIACGPF